MPYKANVTFGPSCALSKKAEWNAWNEWFISVGVVAARYCDIFKGDNPFSYNEAASVSILSAAAALAGHVGIADYRVTKRVHSDATLKSHGRGDYYMCTETYGWMFEFKSLIANRVPTAGGRLESRMARAVKCADQSIVAKGDRAVAGLIVSLPTYLSDLARKRTKENVAAFSETCHATCFLAVPGTGVEATFLFRFSHQ